MSDRPSRQESAVAWELRGAWAVGREVIVAWDGGRVRGYVEHVSPTDAFALIWDGLRELHIPLLLRPSVRRPHFHEPLDRAVAPRPRKEPIYIDPQQLVLWTDEDTDAIFSGVPE